VAKPIKATVLSEFRTVAFDLCPFLFSVAMSDIVALDHRYFVAADSTQVSDWPCVIAKRLEPILTIKDDDLFMITDTLGNIAGCSDDNEVTSMGLFCRDTRFLSRLELQINQQSPILLSSSAQKGFALSILCANPRLEQDIPAEVIGIERDIVLNGGLFEEIILTNYGTDAVAFELSLSFAADFTDLFQIRGYQRPHQGQLLQRVEMQRVEKAVADTPPNPTDDTPIETADSEATHPGQSHGASSYVPFNDPTQFTMAYRGLDEAIVESHVQFFQTVPDAIKGYTAIWTVALEPRATTKLGYRLNLLINNQPASKVDTPITLKQAKAAEILEEQTWRNSITQIRTDNKAINQVIERAEQDIYLLRQTIENNRILSAGVPWFCTLFGRDSIIAASQTLILDPNIARETLTLLAQYQGQKEDAWRDEEPGKILHELRMGEMARCQEIPHTPYYGTVDATPLWLMLYAEYYAWTSDRDTLEKLWPHARAAMEWLDRSTRSTGYLTYARRSGRGLDNQGWKDSGNCIVYRDGTLATGPIALCEVQAYLYAAKIRMSEIARIRKRIDLADRWQEEASALKRRFNQDFWLTDEDFCALALDGAGKPVDSITSNPGHCLNLGILEEDKAKSVAERLQAPDMFSGWGIRTLSSLSPAYNPMGYHTGSVWPHDNSLVALGLRSINAIEQSLELGQAIFDMTMRQPYQRPPELFCGYQRDDHGGDPVRYPVACSPQAWATGTIFQLLQMTANLVPDAPGNHLRIIDPALPPSIQHLTMSNLQVGSTWLDIELVREGNQTTAACRVTKKRGNLRVVIEA
jgi:glycogen debranching enzyme